MNQKYLDTEPYKGVRDFYPEDMFVRNYIFSIMRKSVESYGYREYDASVLESTEIYKAKSGSEIVDEQTYTFIDKGDREVSLRPEMTPTVSRLVAKKRRDLPYPLRLYSIPNVFRYERPQKGRLREHWQLNVDLFGDKTLWGDVEVIQVAYAIMRGFGAKDSDFEIKVYSRNIANYIFDSVLKIDKETSHRLSKLIDNLNKVSETDFLAQLTEIIPHHAPLFMKALSSRSLEEFLDIFSIPQDLPSIQDVVETMKILDDVGVKNVVFDPTLMRGFDYYDGIIFEVFDTHPENKKAIAGGGRYNGLIELFGVENTPAIGFGMGDFRLLDFLLVRNLVPEYLPQIDLYLVSLTDDPIEKKKIVLFSESLRMHGIKVSLDVTDKKIPAKIKNALKQHIPYFAVVGSDELQKETLTIKDLSTEEEKTVGWKDIPNFFAH